MLAVAVVAAGLLIAQPGPGYALRAIHQDEDAAAAMGVNTTRVKTLAFAGSAALTGAIGAAYAFQQVTIYPDRLFDVEITVLMVVMVILGGAGTVLGPVHRRGRRRVRVGVAAPAPTDRAHLRARRAHRGGGDPPAAGVRATTCAKPRGSGEFSLLGNVRRYRL